METNAYFQAKVVPKPPMFHILKGIATSEKVTNSILT